MPVTITLRRGLRLQPIEGSASSTLRATHNAPQNPACWLGINVAHALGFSAADRAARSEYWYWTLFAVLVSIVTLAVERKLIGDPSSN